VGAAVLLLALRDVLIWTNILPSPPNHDTTIDEDEEHAEGMHRLKLQVINRLARNMLMSQFHDVVGPMILSRTVFSGITKYTQQIQENLPLELQWTYHWRIALFVFTVRHYLFHILLSMVSCIFCFVHAQLWRMLPQILNQTLFLHDVLFSGLHLFLARRGKLHLDQLGICCWHPAWPDLFMDVYSKITMTAVLNQG
jgi:hypothetical protein